MSEKIKLVSNGNGTYTEPGGSPEAFSDSDVVWVRTSCTEPREGLDECVVCGKEIEEWDLWLCMDGGDSAHQGCVQIQEEAAR